MPDDTSPEAAWRRAVDKVLKGAAFDRLVGRSLDDLPVGPLYAKAEAPAPVLWRDVAAPIRVFTRLEGQGLRSAPEAVGEGATGLTLAFANATPGTDDLATLASLPLGGVALRVEAPPFAEGEAVRARLAAVLAGLAVEVEWGVDPIGDLARTGTLPIPWPDLGTATATEAKRLGGIALQADGRIHHEAGASEAQELAAVLATGVAYLRLFGNANEARRHIGFTLAADADQFMTMARMRALRRLWARIEEACGLEPQPIRLHAETARRMLTRRDPHTNLLRNTLACTAAILGGADSLCVLPHTAALGGAPDPVAERLARNLALVLLEEAHLGRVADPAAGSGGFEALTDGLCRAAWSSFQEIERAGGLVRALETGSWQASLADMRARRARAPAAIVGTTLFARPDEPALPALPVRSAASLALPSIRDAEPYEGDA